jgi:hypothetical protein
MIGPIFRALASPLTDLVIHPLKERIFGPVVRHCWKYFTSHAIVRRVALVASPLMALAVVPHAGSALGIHHRSSDLLLIPFIAAIVVGIVAMACEIYSWRQTRRLFHFVENSIDTVRAGRTLRKKT